MIGQVDQALKTICAVTVNSVAVPVIVGGSKEFTNLRKWPIVGMQLYDFLENKDRKTQQLTYVKEPGNSRILYREPARCFDLYYQVEAQSEYPMDDREFLEKFGALFAKGYIVAVHSRTAPATENLTLDVVDFVELDDTDKEIDKVIYRKIWRIKIEAFLDEDEDTISTNVAVGVTVNMKHKE